MKIFSCAAILLSLVLMFFGFLKGDLLQIFSSLSMCLAFVFLFSYQNGKSKKNMTLFSVFILIYGIIGLVGFFITKE